MSLHHQLYETKEQFAKAVYQRLSFKNETSALGVYGHMRRLVIFKSTVCKQWKFYQKKTHLLHPLTSKRKRKQICFVFCLQKKNKKKRNPPIKQERERAREREKATVSICFTKKKTNFGLFKKIFDFLFCFLFFFRIFFLHFE